MAAPIPAVFDAMHSALSSMARVERVDVNASHLVGRAPVNIWSLGERIEVWIGAQPEGSVVTVESRCRLKTQFIDWGRNHRNIKRLQRAAEALLPTSCERPTDA
jgi:hypothetical protein